MVVSLPSSRLVCAGCGAEPSTDEPYPFRCPDAHGGDDVDHVLRRELDLPSVRFPVDDSEPNPFIRYRGLLHAYHLGLRRGLSEEGFCRLVRHLDTRVAALDEHGFRVTPFRRSARLSRELGFSRPGGVWVKDETRNVSGSHKARHLFDVLLYLEVAERVGLVEPPLRRELAIASCGNAALAAAVVAAAGERTLRVFVPTDADPIVLTRLEELGALVTVCTRDGRAGDPTYRRLLAAIERGALPFTCQGNLNGLAIEGGETLGWEIASSGVDLDRLVVQVGGGALASASIQSLREAVQLGVLHRSPRVDTVQTAGGWPLKRAFDAVAGPGEPASSLRFAARHRSAFMWPWEEEPRSVAHGILDDETYDWLAVVEGMLATGGRPVVVDEETLVNANALARRGTGIDVDHTGSAGLAGLLALRSAGEVAPDERVAVLFTGAVRAAPTRGRKRDEELPGTRHPVAQGLRAR
jgi:threonine synthase